MAALSRVFSLASVNHNTNTAFAPQPVLCVPDLRLLPHDSNGVPLTHAAARAFQRCEARLARTEPYPNKVRRQYLFTSTFCDSGLIDPHS